MTHQSHQTNGASLEDCHTNFFALTELCGIKWRKFVWGESGRAGPGGGPLEDPVISSYARCLASDILCVWRRVPTAPPPQPSHDVFDTTPAPPPQPPPLSLRAAKELWIFWYGEEPDINSLIPRELIDSCGDSGSWENGGLSYECRSLLFKALHNLIERCLLSRDFIRLGKWFVQPYDGDEDDVGKSCWHLSFSFAFFLHESNVCASVDVRQHPPVRTLTAQRLAKLSSQHASTEDAPANHAKVILAPFGLDGVLTGQTFNSSDPSTARLLDSWRHFYPVSGESDMNGNVSTVEVMVGGVRMRYPSRYVLLTDMDPLATTVSNSCSPDTGAHPQSQYLPAKLADVMAERTYRGMCNQTPQPESCNGEAQSDKMDWDFVDSNRKTICNCSKWWRRSSGRRGAERSGQRRPAPFHRRSAPPRPHHRLQAGSGTPGGGCSPGSCGAPSPAPPCSAPPSVNAAPAPSPSPHHQTLQGGQPTTPRSTAQQIPMMHTPAPTPDPNAPPTPRTPRDNYNQTTAESPAAAAGGTPANGAEVGGAELLKRPVLATRERAPHPTDDEHTLHMLYDYTTMHAWLDHPVKRFKSEDPSYHWGDEMTIGGGNCGAVGGTGSGDLYSGHNHIKMAPILDRNFMNDMKQEQNDDSNKDLKSLYTSNGLMASYRDLDQIFDNSDDAASGDETVRLLQVHTPPDSNKSVAMCVGEERPRVRPEELCKMFPTPPSMEAHAQPSPGAPGHPDAMMTDVMMMSPRAASPHDEPIEDWSYVFKPPTICKYVGSSKYAPLANLPSQLLPPVALPTHSVYRPRWGSNSGQEVQQVNQTIKQEPRSVPPPSPSIKQEPRTSLQQPPTPHQHHQQLANLHSTGTISAPPSVGVASASPALVRAAPPYTASPPSPASSCSGAPPPQACALLLNLLLTDTVLNIFRDHNFDSCTLCVCGDGPKGVGNIRGADASVYLPSGGVGSPSSPGRSPPPAAELEDSFRCSCGFSAVVNRRLAHRAGLFYEDEMEITGLAEDPAEYKKTDSSGPALGPVLELIREHCTGVSSTANALARAARELVSASTADEMRVNLLEYTDGSEAASLALESAAAGGAAPRAPPMHRWPFIGARGPRSSRDVVRVMLRLQPLLQDAIQKKCSTRLWDAVTGPLTWRQFHRLAGRGTNDVCEPQPVPPLLVGHDRDWISLSPYALHYWEKLALEPYSYARDAAYLVVAPEGEALTDPLRTFFRELSTAYEMCRLGRHTPLGRVAPDGLIRVGRAAATGEEEWAPEAMSGRAGELVRAYASTLRSVLVPQLATLQLDRSLLEQESRGGAAPPASPMPPPPSTPDHPPTPNSQSDQESDSAANTANTPTTTNSTTAPWSEAADEESGTPMLVLYLVEPTGAADEGERRAASLALLRCAAQLLAALPVHLRHYVCPKIISLEAIGDTSGWQSSRSRGHELRALAFSVFTQSRRLLQHQPNVKSLTGFGTAASADLFLKSKDEKNRCPYKLYSPAFVLAPPKAVKDVVESFGQIATEQFSVMYLSYCLSADQSWLLAVATDARGELLESTAINIDVPGRARRRRAPPARRLGLTKLMDFVLGVMSQTAQPWRLVVGRIGRIGHGELKGWSWLLSKKNLLKASSVLREICSSCVLLYPNAVPSILSACLVSTEPDSSLRLMADRFTPDERFSQASMASQLHTPRDVTCTHILVFPTSATTQSQQGLFQDNPNTCQLLDEDLWPENDPDMQDDMNIEGMNDLDDILKWDPTASPEKLGGEGDEFDGGASGAGSPGRTMTGRAGGHSPYGQNEGGNRVQEEVGILLQQPLALGYLVSTAPLGAMPAWWWAACPHLRGRCPAFLKNALHLHSVAHSNDELVIHQHQSPTQHPLDSQITTDVLRYVLEGYNALSWLALDSNTHDRLSCMPLHVQVLMQLYHTASALL